VLGVSRSGYYEWKRASVAPRSSRQAALTDTIINAFQDLKRRYGSPRITRMLRDQGEKISRKTVAKIMRRHELRAKAARKYKATTNSAHALPVAENLIKQDFCASRPNEKWVSDITYIWTEEGWVYLAVILDLFTRKIVGWHAAARMDVGLVLDALTMAIKNSGKIDGVILHSDRGSQYCAKVYQEKLRQHDIICSMSKKGDCYDNAAMESWNHSFKVEAILGEKFATRAQAMADIFDYIEVFYNRQRLHSSLGYVTPQRCEDLFNVNLSRVAEPSRSDLPLTGLH
jgi:putative transposase